MNNNARALFENAEKYGLIEALEPFGRNLKIRIPYSMAFSKVPIDNLELSVRSRNGLMRAGLDTVDKLILTVIDICDGQTAEIPQWHIRKYYGKLYRTIKECRERYLDFDISEINEAWKLENITEFKTSVGKIIVTDKDNNRIPFTVKKSVYCCPIQVFAEDNERLRYLLYPKHNYSIIIYHDNLSIGQKYRAVFTGGRLEYGNSDENTVCISGIFGKYSFAFGAYIPNENVSSPDNYEQYLMEINSDCTGYDFELIDNSHNVCFEVAWLKNNDEPRECLSACECWVT